VSNEQQQGQRQLKQATFGGGCFWCVEAVYQQVKGVEKLVSGYAGGHVPNPTYRQVCGGATGHAEVVQITYDPAVISFAELLEVFWKTHDPTTLNRQGNDVGTQYRSVVFAHDEAQLREAMELKAKLNASGAFNRPIVTQVEPLQTFYPAEEYHQNYYRRNPREGYCQYVIVPKLEKFRQVFPDKRKQ
jgi:peptide-methionine (S)-S-oxide reductase